MAIVYPDNHGHGVGTAGSDRVYGDSRVNILAGLAGNDTLWGRGGGDLIDGGRGNDRIYGDSGNDILNGAWGRDILTGGSGRDVFSFDAKPTRTTIDRITDFSVKDDTIMLEKSIFKSAGTANKTLKASAFWKGEKAHDANDRIIYNDKTGAVYYDPDGTGSKAAVQFATVSKKLKMTYKDFLIVDL